VNRGSASWAREHLNCPGKKHFSGVGLLLIAAAKIKKNLLAHLMLFFNVE